MARDNDHRNKAANNLDLACPLCHATQHIMLACHGDFAQVGYLPELTQIQVAQLAYVLWFAELALKQLDSTPVPEDRRRRMRAWSTNVVSAREQMMSSFNKLINTAIDKTSMLTDFGFPVELLLSLHWPTHFSTEVLAEILQDFALEKAGAYEHRGELLGGLRLIPTNAFFDKIFSDALKSWAGRCDPHVLWQWFADIDEHPDDYVETRYRAAREQLAAIRDELQAKAAGEGARG
jgi:hypothetical protein